eukprot:TRINITY_DN3314_c5_g1_i1.p3 TRINITY_DN3314_c5_g1~~TRINITY_DN3314_c5_g1_i1.p3  ORF type:complete len:141 (-),score=41.80 TRINITY_DN3314_c5_g1_i1:513-935(-)
MIYNLYVFDRAGTCLYYADWHRRNKSENLEGEFKLVYGMLFLLKRFLTATSPSQDGDGSFDHFLTDTYRLHYFESATGVKFCLLSHPSVPDLRDHLLGIYQAMVDTVVKNPLYKLGDPIECSLFKERVDQLISSHPRFAQ